MRGTITNIVSNTPKCILNMFQGYFIVEGKFIQSFNSTKCSFRWQKKTQSYLLTKSIERTRLFIISEVERCRHCQQDEEHTLLDRRQKSVQHVQCHKDVEVVC